MEKSGLFGHVALETADTLPGRGIARKTRNLGLRIVTLHERGRSVMAIADTVGKTDKVVKRYLREAQEAGLLGGTP